MLGFGLTVAGLGIGIVFAELILLVFVIQLLSKAAEMLECKKKPAQAEASKPARPPEVTVRAQEDEKEVVAVLSAAVAYVMSSGTVGARAAGENARAWNFSRREDWRHLNYMIIADTD